MHLAGVPEGVGWYEDDYVIYYATFDDNEMTGFLIEFKKTYGSQYQLEMRENDVEGFGTKYYASD